MTITPEVWFAARSRVLTRDAEAAASTAEQYRQRAASFPDDAADLDRLADGLDRYAAECRAAAADPALPNPTYAGTHPETEG